MDPISALAIASLVARLLGGAAETARNVRDIRDFKRDMWGEVKGHLDSGEIEDEERYTTEWVQAALNKVQDSKLKVDGVAGARTRLEVVKFQKAVGIPVDGIPGPITLAALITAVKQIDDKAVAEVHPPMVAADDKI